MKKAFDTKVYFPGEWLKNYTFVYKEEELKTTTKTHIDRDQAILSLQTPNLPLFEFGC